MTHMNTPEKITLTPNKYALCTCGLSLKFPHCDGAHKGTNHVPKIEVVEVEKEIYVCRCGNSTNMPYCDGSHLTLEENKNGQ